MKHPLLQVLQAEDAKQESFLDVLKRILHQCQSKSEFTIGEIVALLAGKGNAALLVLFCLPFCLPIQIPGLSTIFGLPVAFLGLRVALGKEQWWPEWALKKTITSAHIKTITKKTMEAIRIIQKVVHPRFVWLTKNPLMHRLHGVIIFIFAILLALPLVLPFSNMIAALPIVCIGLGLLEDDGLFILVGYLLAFLTLGLIASLIIWLL